MNTINKSKLKKLALYTSLVIGSSFFIVACDNSKSPESASSSIDASVVKDELPAPVPAMSPQEQSDFIKNVMTNFVTKYNLSQTIAKASLVSYTPSEDLQQISMVLEFSINDPSDLQPTKAVVSYLIKPEQSLQNNAYTIANYASQNISYVPGDNNSSDNITQQFFANAGVLSSGYVMASGDIINNLTTSEAFNYVNENAKGDDFSSVSIDPLTYHAETKDNMGLIGYTFHLPKGTMESKEVKLSVKNLDAKVLNHSFDSNYSYTGQDEFKVETVNINYDGKPIVLNNAIWRSQTDINNQKLINQTVSTSFTGKFKNPQNSDVNLSVDANLTVKNLNVDAAEKWNKYTLNAGAINNKKSIEYMLEAFKYGFSFAITDSHIKLNDAEGVVNFSFDVAPMNASPSNQNAAAMQLLNNLTIGVDSQIPVEWLTILGLGGNKNYVDAAVKQAIQQVDLFGYNGALTYDGKTIVAKFELKKGNIFVNGELKGSLMNTLSAFM